MTALAEYAERFARLNAEEAGAKWKRGDLILEIEAEHGDAWLQFADDPRAPSRQVLLAERRTAAAYPPRKRRRDLSWTHHWRVLRLQVRLEDGSLDTEATDHARAALLEQAERDHWSAAEMDAEVTALQAAGDSSPADPTAMERVPYIVARLREKGTRITDGVVADMLAVDHEWRTANERLPFDEPPPEGVSQELPDRDTAGAWA